jgi:NAD-dependent dihydropyrimidine dehydrogenase PreA subunit
MVRTNEKIPGVEWADGTGNFITIDEEKCDGCTYCVRVCPGRVFKFNKNKKAFVANLGNCLECGACFIVCETDAINFSWPAGGTGYRSDWG